MFVIIILGTRPMCRLHLIISARCNHIKAYNKKRRQLIWKSVCAPRRTLHIASVAHRKTAFAIKSFRDKICKINVCYSKKYMSVGNGGVVGINHGS